MEFSHITGCDLSGQRGFDQTLARTPPLDRRHGTTLATRSDRHHSCREVSCAGRPTDGPSRCHAHGPYRPVEGKSRRDGESLDHESRTAHCWLDAQKKTLIAQERDACSRAVFQVEITTVAAEDVIVIDESSTNVHLTPRMAWAPRGQRAYGSVPRNTPPNITLIASLTTSGIGPSLLLEGGVDTAAFVVYIEQVLAPTLRPGQIVLLDNLSVHKTGRSRPQLSPAGVSSGSYRPIRPTYRRSSWPSQR